MTSIQDTYDRLILNNPAKAIEADVRLRSEMEQRDCKFGEQLIPTFLKPLFLHRTQAKSITHVLAHIISILEKVIQLYFTNPELREFFYINDQAKPLIELEHGYSKNILICRPDSFLVNDTLRFVEFNCDSPAGAGYTDSEEDILKTLFPLDELKTNYQFAPHHRLDSLLATLLDAYKEFAGENKTPNIAIIDWKEVRTQNEFVILKKFFESRGYATTIADPRDLEYSNGHLSCQGFPIHLVYRRVIFRELMEKLDEVQPFISAYADKRICVVNPFRSRLASNKAILSIITNLKKFGHLFSQEEREIIQKHIPWTRRVIDIETNYQNNHIFLLKHIQAHKDQLVLKPSDSYGGKDVLIGKEVTQQVWDALTARIISKKEDWVVQRFVPITEMSVPRFTQQRIDFQVKKYNINPFVFNGSYAGSVARLSDKSVINVSAGGGLIPAIQYQERAT